jgi:hypothetical protein
MVGTADTVGTIRNSAKIIVRLLRLVGLMFLLLSGFKVHAMLVTKATRSVIG